MGRSIAAATAVSTLFGLFVMLGVHQAQAAPKNECLSAPNGVSPKGQHWYYHLDRTTQRKCWYLRSTDLGREAAEDLTVDKKKAQAIESPKSSAPEPSADANRAAMSASSAAQTYANAVPAPQMTDLPRPADLSGPSAGAENKQPLTAESPEAPNDQDQSGSLQGAAGLREAPQGPAPEVRDVDATVAAGTTEAQPQIAAAGAATENIETARHDLLSAEPAVSSTTSQGSIAGITTVVVIAAATVLAALAGFVLMVARRRRQAMEDVLLPDQATSAPEGVASADVLSARTRELLLRCLEEPAPSPTKRERAL